MTRERPPAQLAKAADTVGTLVLVPSSDASDEHQSEPVLHSRSRRHRADCAEDPIAMVPVPRSRLADVYAALADAPPAGRTPCTGSPIATGLLRGAAGCA